MADLKTYVVWSEISYEGMITGTLRVCVGESVKDRRVKELEGYIAEWDEGVVGSKYFGDYVKVVETTPLT